MIKLTYQTPFGFLALETNKLANNTCGTARLDDSFHLHGDNYYIYTCSTCQAKQIKQGKQPSTN